MKNMEFPNFKDKNLDKEPNISFVREMCDDLKAKGYKVLPDVVGDIFHDISSQSSTVNLFQVIDVEIMKELEENLGSQSQLITDKSTLSLKNECIQKYPVLYDRLKRAALLPLSNGDIPLGVKKLYSAIISFVLEFYEKLDIRDQDADYSRRQGEIKAEVFPQFPTIFQRPMYEADRRLSKKDKDSWDTLCTKLFPEHTQLTPGLFIVSCCCPQKKIYGYKKMVQGESPRIIFDIITTRFEEWYNPNIIYDASCRVKEMGLNREPERFMNILITSDPLHIPNHTTCSQSFQSKIYEQLKPLNKEACEQFNSILRNIQVSLTYMSFEHYMAAMKVFVTFHNNSK